MDGHGRCFETGHNKLSVFSGIQKRILEMEEIQLKVSTFKTARLGALLCVGALGFAAQAHALDIDATDLSGWTLNLDYWTVPGNTALFADDVEGLTDYSPGELASAYKAEAGTTVVESGVGKDYYSTVFDLTSTDPSKATITWGGGLWIDCPDCFLVVKDGNAVPSAYIFDLGNWNGQDTITLTNFWPSKGAISYVEIFGSTTDGGGPPLMVPEAETYAMMLAGLGLVGFAAARRRRG